MKGMTILCVLALALVGGVAEAGEGVSADAAFEKLKGPRRRLAAGRPTGSGNEEAEAATGMPARHVFELSAGATVVMETMDPGGDHEMINMYHLDGEELVLTHYCAGGNQPQMRLKRSESSADNLMFEFVGGTNLDAETDHHIHDAAITWNEDGTLTSTWRAFGGGEHIADMVFTLSRSDG